MNKKTAQAILELLNKIEQDIIRIKTVIKNAEFDKSEMPESIEVSEKDYSVQDKGGVKVVDGIFDGYLFVGPDGKKFPVPLNYSSKSKLIPGDKLKLYIYNDGQLVYKIIKPAPRKFLKATVSKTADGKFTAITDDGKIYYLNLAAATYFKIKPGDEISLIVNSEGKGNFGAIEGVVNIFPDISNDSKEDM